MDRAISRGDVASWPNIGWDRTPIRGQHTLSSPGHRPAFDAGLSVVVTDALQ
jgi:hypothetical protein